MLLSDVEHFSPPEFWEASPRSLSLEEESTLATPRSLDGRIATAEPPASNSGAFSQLYDSSIPKPRQSKLLLQDRLLPSSRPSSYWHGSPSLPSAGNSEAWKSHGGRLAAHKMSHVPQMSVPT